LTWLRLLNCGKGWFIQSKDKMRTKTFCWWWMMNRLKMARAVPPGWEKKNMKLVLSTEMVRGGSWCAKVVAVQC